MVAIMSVVFAGGQAPAFWAIAFIALGILDAVGAVDQCVVCILLPVIGVFVLKSLGIQAHEGILRQEQRPAHFGPERQGDTLVGLAIFHIIPCRPSLVVNLRRYGMCR